VEDIGVLPSVSKLRTLKWKLNQGGFYCMEAVEEKPMELEQTETILVMGGYCNASKVDTANMKTQRSV
jgi:hypothetical protein